MWSKSPSTIEPTCCNPSLGLVTKARACKVVGQERKESVREWTLTVPRDLPPWELESWWTPRCSESDCKGQNPMDWRILYTIGKLLKLKYLKWARMTYLNIWNTSYGQKKTQKWNCQFDSQPLKVRFSCMQVTCNILLKRSQQELQLCFRPHLNQRSSHKIMGAQSCESPNFGNFGTLRVLGQNVIWMWASWRSTKYTIRWKVVASPKFGPWWVLWVRVCPWFVLALKMLQLCTNHFVFGFVQVSVSSWCLSLHPRTPARPSTPQSAVSQGACYNSLLFHCF